MGSLDGDGFDVIASRNARHPIRNSPLRRPATAGFLAAGLLVTATHAAVAFTPTQAQDGARVYARQCARCHGPKGEGKDNAFNGLRAPEVIGKGALPLKPRPSQQLRKTDFRTAKDVYDFVSATMPADQPAILSAQEYWDVVAFTLEKNGVKADGKPLVDTSSAQITLHPPPAP
jgi:cytochrome c